jgi:hypothetical protein
MYIDPLWQGFKKYGSVFCETAIIWAYILSCYILSSDDVVMNLKGHYIELSFLLFLS